MRIKVFSLTLLTLMNCLFTIKIRGNKERDNGSKYDLEKPFEEWWNLDSQTIDGKSLTRSC